jgi:hypothetical protein
MQAEMSIEKIVADLLGGAAHMDLEILHAADRRPVLAPK